MDIRQLQYFISVAEHLNFTEASRHLFVAQSAVSYQISSLEKDLGVKLFLRDKHHVQLTSAGKVFQKEATFVLDSFDNAIEKAQHADAGILGNLRIGFLGVKVINQLPEMLKNFLLINPDINVELEQLNAEQITNALEDGSFDVGFTRSFSIQDNPDLVYKRVYTDTLSVIMRFDHPMAEQKTIQISNLAQESFISVNRQYSPGIFDLLIKLCSTEGFSPSIIRQPQQIETVLCLVEAGMGISIIPNCFKSYLNEKFRIIPIEGKDVSIDLVVAWNKNTSNRSIPLFLAELEKYYQ